MLMRKKFRMICKEDGNLQLGSRDWSMYSRILKKFPFFTTTLPPFIREFKIPQRGRQRQLQNLFLCFPAEKLTAKAYHKRLVR